MKTLSLALVLSFFHNPVFAQAKHIELDWHDVESSDDLEENYTKAYRPVASEQCLSVYKDRAIMPVYVYREKMTGNQTVSKAILENINFSTRRDLEYPENLFSADFKIEIDHYTSHRDRIAIVRIYPIRQSGSNYDLLSSFDLKLTYESTYNPSNNARNKKDQTYTSVLSDGDIYKIAVPSNGLYKITKSFLSENGISTSGKKLSEFKLYGNGGAMLLELLAAPRAEDLLENALWVVDKNGNDAMDDDDYILWYAEGPDSIAYDSESEHYSYSKNDFENKAYYFIKWDAGAGKRMSTNPNGQGLNEAITLNWYDYIYHHESDEINFIQSGRRWWGDEISNPSSKSFFISLEGALTGETMTVESRTAVRSLNNGNLLRVNVNSQQVLSFSYSRVSGEYDQNFCDAPAKLRSTTSVPGQEFTVSFNYNQPHPDAKAWIDFFTLTVPRRLEAFNAQQVFFNRESSINGVVQYQIQNLPSNYRVLNITEAYNAQFQNTYSDGTFQSFKYNASDERINRYLIVNESAAFQPEFVAKVENQNYHGLADVEYLIFSHPSFLEDAERLAEFHREYSDLTVEVINIHKLYNEFSSGGQDVTAIRDFIKLIYDRGLNGSKELKYALLFGDASYDYKNRIEGNTNIVPIYQSYNSYSPTVSHCSDDYYAILGDDEGKWAYSFNNYEGMDINVGRLPAQTQGEAKLMVDKIINYHSENSMGNWVHRTTLLADDQDNNFHVEDGEFLSNFIINQSPQINVNKIWLDAYEQVSFGSGNKYPEVNEDVNNYINNGSLVFHYTGHGGQSGMAHERVVTRPMMSSWSNYNRLCFFITASCELAAFDNPVQKSPAELMLINNTGGAVGLISTTRVVYFDVNQGTNAAIVNDNLFEVVDNKYKTLGEIYAKTRNRIGSGGGGNSRSFMLLADPAMRLHHPENNVVTTSINGQNAASFSDTLKALSKVTIAGEIRDNSDQLMTDFNGTVYPTFYDKFATYQTRGNDPNSPVIEFELQNNVIYKGKISVVNGKFEFSFIVPKDISYQYGDGKMSYYANSGIVQADGYDEILIGGTTDSLKDDQVPPILNLFIDDRTWVFGGTTNNTPLLLADLFDENGINTVGSGIGREMEAIIDEGLETEQRIILNDFYQPELNSYQAGVIEYRMTDIAPGRHTVKLKIWDAYNNASEAYTEFMVYGDEGLVVNNLLNYPNPFTTFTTFHFDHNRAGQNIIANLTIYSVSGNVVMSKTVSIPNAQTHSSDITWDGRDDFGDPIGRGVYLYTLEIKAEDGSTEKKTEKLYIIN
ncbi:type IX secretion system sortase PorU [bacterium]|nr:type IX secretion system sortase PorU [bacterium]